MPLNSRFTWDLDKLQFRDSRTGRFVPPQHVFRQVNRVINVSQKRMLSLADQVRARTISVSQFKDGMKQEVKALHVATSIAANGGLAQMTPARWGAVGGRLRSEYTYLNRFGKNIGARDLPRESARIRSRARAYTANARLAYWETLNTRMEQSGMIVLAARKMGAVQTEHCGGCVSVAESWMALADLPAIGVMECKWFCCCSVVYKLQRGPKLTQPQLESLSEQVDASTSANPILATNLTNREREMLERIRLEGRVAFTDRHEAYRALNLFKRGQLQREKVGGRLVYFVDDIPKPIPVPGVVPPVVPPTPPPPIGVPSPFPEPLRKLTKRELEVFQKITSSGLPVKMRELNRYDAHIARRLWKQGEFTRTKVGPDYFYQRGVLPGSPVPVAPVVPRVVAPVVNVPKLSKLETDLLRSVYRGKARAAASADSAPFGGTYLFNGRTTTDRAIQKLVDKKLLEPGTVRGYYHAIRPEREIFPLSNELTVRERRLLKNLYRRTGDRLTDSQYITLAGNEDAIRSLVERGLIRPDITKSYFYQPVLPQAEALPAIPRPPLPARFKTVSEAETWARAAHPDIAWDFGKTHIDVIDPTVRELDRLIAQYPEVAERLKYIGSYNDKQLIADAGLGTRGHNFPKKEWAHAATDGSRIGINPKWYGNPSRFLESVTRSEATGFHPMGTANFEHVMTHEWGHQVDHWLSSSKDKDTSWATIQFRNETKRTDDISGYALHNAAEGWAESFTAMRYTHRGQWSAYTRAHEELLKRLIPNWRL